MAAQKYKFSSQLCRQGSSYNPKTGRKVRCPFPDSMRVQLTGVKWATKDELVCPCGARVRVGTKGFGALYVVFMLRGPWAQAYAACGWG